MSRVDAVKQEQKNKAEGGFGVPRKWYINQKFLDETGMKQYKAKEGTNFLYLCPPANDPDCKKYFGLKIFVHYNIGANTDAYLCPKMMLGKKCVLCEKREKLKAANAPADVVKAFSSFPPRYLFIAYDCASPETEEMGPQVYDAPQTINDEILGLSKDKRTGEVIDISDPKKGKILAFDREGKGAHNTKYRSFSLEALGDVPKEWLDVVPAFEDLLHYGTEEEMLASLGVETRVEEPDDASPSEQAAPAKVATRSRTATVAAAVEEKKVEPVKEETKAEEPVRRRRIARDEAPAVEAEPVKEQAAAPAAEPEAENDIRARLRARLAAKSKE